MKINERWALAWACWWHLEFSISKGKLECAKKRDAHRFCQGVSYRLKHFIWKRLCFSNSFISRTPGLILIWLDFFPQHPSFDKNFGFWVRLQKGVDSFAVSLQLKRWLVRLSGFSLVFFLSAFLLMFLPESSTAPSLTSLKKPSCRYPPPPHPISATTGNTHISQRA